MIPSFSWDLIGAFGRPVEHDGLRLKAQDGAFGVQFRERDERNPSVQEWGRDDATEIEARRLFEMWQFSRGCNPIGFHETNRNMLVWSADMVTGWTNQSATAGWARETATQTMTTQVATGPLGGASHPRLEGTGAATAASGVYQDIGHFLPKEGPWGTLTLSCYFKEVDSVEEQLELSSVRSGTTWTARFDWTSSVLGVLASPTNGTASVADAGSGWHRASLALDVASIGADIRNGDVIRATIRTGAASPFDTGSDLGAAQLEWGVLSAHQTAGAHRLSPRPMLMTDMTTERLNAVRWRLGATLMEDVA